MTVLWTIILILTAQAPSVDVIRELCLRGGGGELKVIEGFLRDDKTGVLYRSLTIHCLPPKEPEKKIGA